MSKIFAWPRYVVKSLIGTRAARQTLRESRKTALHPKVGIHTVFTADELSDPASDEAPIFILSVGWRSGSTLLQRLVCSGKDVLIWGEPFDRSGLIQSLARSAAPFTQDWPPDGYIKPSDDLTVLQDQWTANLYPSQTQLCRAYRAFLMQLFAEPAYALGATRWGIKEVRFGYTEAIFLHKVFPKARFLFIRRHLPDAYLSYKGFNGSMDWFSNWPEQPAFTPFSFARHWARLSKEAEQAAKETGGILIEYDALVAGDVDIAQLSDYCGFDIDDGTLQNRVGSGRKDDAQQTVGRLEAWLLRLGAYWGRSDAGRHAKNPLA